MAQFQHPEVGTITVSESVADHYRSDEQAALGWVPVDETPTSEGDPVASDGSPEPTKPTRGRNASETSTE